MSQQPVQTVSGKLILLIKAGYWLALLIIAAMVIASFILLQQMMATQQHNHTLLDIVSTQKTLSQRIVFLASATGAGSRDKQPALVSALKQATAEFETNYDLLLDQTGADPQSPAKLDPKSIESVLFAKPFHLDYFSVGLIANGDRLISAYESQFSGNGGYKGGGERVNLDASVANATLSGYAALGQRITADADDRSEKLLALHRTLFYATIGVIILVALFIFRPMSNAILRKTHELIDARNSMAFIAVHDGLTGLHNRTFLTDHFDTLIKGTHRRRERLAVVQLDLDRFKQINDTLGHAAGDYVLVVTAQRMRDSCRASDLCVRLGGDEFVMILGGAGGTEDINMLARRILAHINEPIVFQGTTILPGASAGIAVYPIDADNAGDLLVHADLALYSAKKLGGGNFSFFSEELRRELDYRKQLEHDIKVAIAERAFQVYFQPQVSLTNGTISGIEALVRWNHAERGMIPPGEFIPVAEKCGFMPEIGRIVITKAINEAAEWNRAGIAFGRLAVNVSGTELREHDFDAFLFETLEKAGLPPQKLSLEIVESVILDDEKTGIAAKLRHIRAAGVHLELDDFGTGYASLSHVNPNEIDRLKIDRRFVQNIHENGDNSKIVRAITELARGLGISIVAEGAETEAELDSLMAIGCDQVQGYSIAFPMPHDKALEWLTARMPKKAKLTVLQGSLA
ncbi:EAL domain-containing protein [Mesorhizobium sp. M7A.F.Ca.CA.001.09.2.1]|uniref:EAL domain-containing protein n=2 Tax=Mesorhizobium TaxID=68287 RepID=A0AB38T6E7_9HYPH|nr:MULTISPECIES: EAL domain-containing protein [Mesorhizobium]RUY52570.1 EAL domain-containing protein [Mesorhizobium sp. M7A.F.Ca.CA.001.13.2.1]RUZ12666.1 EAL domain-containing protein [Mesorhizobium sp. M7A.F.Ca.CA.001.09.1.1]RUZ32685.1 EAL domain-containing protein [Mesorhizobium sp. M7A.F.Ca.CA.001.15.1.1]RVA77016.1 EAL domain-containing protein [Mesorhizobium sp. M7A.F.Ca.CA.001.08.2.1]RVA79422.1 EAL domain-containing protein [Mesorhizobium sp. M7A.F.Ca.CA.001.11.2.1]